MEAALFQSIRGRELWGRYGYRPKTFPGRSAHQFASSS